MSYITKVQGYNPIAYWPLNEAAGGTAEDLSGNDFDGAYTGVTLGQTGIGDGETAPLFDGSNDFCDIYSTGFRDEFALTNHNGGDPVAEGTMIIWAKMFNVGTWTDGSNRRALTLRVANFDNRMYLYKRSINNRIQFSYEASGTEEHSDKTSITTTDWMFWVQTWSKTADEVKCYFDGTQFDVTDTGLGVWVGNLANTFIGSQTSGPGLPWHGYLAHCAVFGSAVPLATIEDLAVVPPPGDSLASVYGQIRKSRSTHLRM